MIDHLEWFTAFGSEDSGLFPGGPRSYNFRINNQSTTSVNSVVKFYEIEETDQEEPQGPPTEEMIPELSDTGSGNYRDRIELSDSQYLVEVTLDGGEKENFIWDLPSGGTPDWMELTIRILPHRDFKISTAES